MTLAAFIVLSSGDLLTFNCSSCFVKKALKAFPVDAIPCCVRSAVPKPLTGAPRRPDFDIVVLHKPAISGRHVHNSESWTLVCQRACTYWHALRSTENPWGAKLQISFPRNTHQRAGHQGMNASMRRKWQWRGDSACSRNFQRPFLGCTNPEPLQEVIIIPVTFWVPKP